MLPTSSTGNSPPGQFPDMVDPLNNFTAIASLSYQQYSEQPSFPVSQSQMGYWNSGPQGPMAYTIQPRILDSQNVAPSFSQPHGHRQHQNGNWSPETERLPVPVNHNASYQNSYQMLPNQQNPQFMQNHHQNLTFPPLGYDQIAPIAPVNPHQSFCGNTEPYGLAMSVNGTRALQMSVQHDYHMQYQSVGGHHHQYHPKCCRKFCHHSQHLVQYHSQQPPPHNQQSHPYMESKRSNARFRYSDRQLAILTSYFETDPYPVGDELTKLVEKLGVTRQQVSTWFQNRRNKKSKTKCVAEQSV